MSWLPLALWGALVGLDATAFPQAMISRPLVAATLTGLLLGRPLEGAVLGAILETFALPILPIGAARYPETGTAAVAATAAYAAATPDFHLPALLLATLFALAWEHAAGASVTLLRRLNERLAGTLPDRPAAGPRDIERRHLAALSLDALRGATTTLLGALAGSLLLRTFAAGWTLHPTAPAAALAAATTAMLAAALHLFGGWTERKKPFTLGLLCGLALLLLLR